MRATTNIMQDEQLRLARVGYSTAAQAIVAATRTYITGSAIPITKAGLREGHIFRWTIYVYKLAAGLAASTYDVCIGTNGTTADAASLSFTKPAGSAAVDYGRIDIDINVRSIGATGAFWGSFNMIHNLAATGHMTIPCSCSYTSAVVDTTVEDLILGVCITSGAGDLITIQQVIAEMR